MRNVLKILHMIDLVFSCFHPGPSDYLSCSKHTKDTIFCVLLSLRVHIFLLQVKTARRPSPSDKQQSEITCKVLRHILIYQAIANGTQSVVMTVCGYN